VRVSPSVPNPCQDTLESTAFTAFSSAQVRLDVAKKKPSKNLLVIAFIKT
jgi:hypothetical protein